MTNKNSNNVTPFDYIVKTIDLAPISKESKPVHTRGTTNDEISKFNSFDYSLPKQLYLWSIPLSFFMIQFLIRIAPGIFMQDIMAQFSMDAAMFGIFSSLYYLGYASMQVPIGVLLDIYHPKKVISFSVMTCALACILLILSQNWLIACLCRVLIGATSVVGFIGCAKVIRSVFHLKHYDKMISYTFTVGFFGAMASFIMIYFSKHITNHQGSDQWKAIFLTAALLILIIAMSAWKSLPHLGHNKEHLNFSTACKFILGHKIIICTSICGGLMVGALEGFADIWGITYLIKSYGISQIQAVFAVSCIFLGVCFGGPVLTFIAQKFSNYYIISYITGILSIICFIILLLANNLNYVFIVFTCFMIGIFAANQVLIFCINNSYSPASLSGFTSSITNMLIMSFGIFFHIIIGFIINYISNGSLDSTHKSYNLQDYKIALSVIPIGSALGVVGLFILSLKRLSSISAK